MTETYTTFDGTRLLAHGPDLAEVLARTLALLATGPRRSVVLFDDTHGRLTDVDATSTVDEIIAVLRPEEVRRTGPGRPKLGVVSREVSLLPRHWDWLGEQPGGASAAIRRLVDTARRSDPGTTDVRLARDAAWRFLSMVAPDVSGAEEIGRALFSGRYDDLRAQVAEDWPADVREHFLRLVANAELRARPERPEGGPGGRNQE